MFKYVLLNSVSEEGLKQLGAEFEKTEDYGKAEAAIVRSAKMHEMETHHLTAIARAGSGTNNIPVARCANEGVVVFNTPGANSNAVKELVILGMLLSARDVIAGSAWVKEAAQSQEKLPEAIEKGKSSFKGREISGKRAAVIGVGAVGSILANTLIDMGMEVAGFSPSLARGEKRSGLNPKVEAAKSIEDAVSGADYVILALPLKEETKGIVNSQLISRMKEGCVMLNFARAELMDEDALEEALDSGRIRKYVTDFTTERVLEMQNTLCLPHMGASTKEATDNCAVMAARQIKDYLTNGNIKNSVNFPDIDMGDTSGKRLSVLLLGDGRNCEEIERRLEGAGVEILRFTSAARNGYGALLADADEISIDTFSEIESMDFVLKARLLYS